MPRTSFDQLPDDARVWVFPAARPLTEEEVESLLARVDAFLEAWAAHGTPLTGARAWRRGRFLMIGVDESTAPPSGCSIDSMVRILKEEGERLGTSFLDQSPIWYLEEGEVISVHRARFRELAGAGRVSAEVTVFDNTVTRLSQIRAGEWEKEARRSWHGKAFFS